MQFPWFLVDGSQVEIYSSVKSISSIQPLMYGLMGVPRHFHDLAISYLKVRKGEKKIQHSYNIQNYIDRSNIFLYFSNYHSDLPEQMPFWALDHADL